jgi:glycosyltransferase involved in cell wall biosynthesis
LRLFRSRKLGPYEEWGVNVIGFHRSDFGIAEAGRRMIDALRAADVPMAALHDVSYGRTETGHPGYPSLEIEEAAYPVNLVVMNGNHIIELADRTGPGPFDGRYTAALWFWEVEAFPKEWRPALRFVDEIWAPSGFVAAAMRPARVPVTRVRVAMTPPDVGPANLSSHGPSAGDFVFLYMFDYGSSGERKNPLAAIRAFRDAFEPGSGAALLLKASQAEWGGELGERVAEGVASHPNIHIVNARLAAAEKDAMIAGCDCYVSLHRSEGFGLGPAEAMALGKPVIATGYGGNLEFMTPENSYLVDHRLVRVGPGNAPYSPRARWAEPDSEHAARLMREVFDDREASAARGRAAAEHMRARHSPRTAGEIAARRLDEIRALFPGPG